MLHDEENDRMFAGGAAGAARVAVDLVVQDVVHRVASGVDALTRRAAGRERAHDLRILRLGHLEDLDVVVVVELHPVPRP